MANHRRRIAALLVATALAPAAMPLVPDHGWHAGLVQAQAQTRQNVAINRIEIPNTFGTVILSGIAVTGSSLGPADIDGLLRASTVTGLADRLQKLDAEKFVVNSIEWRYKQGAQDMVTVYEGLEASGIKAGLIERLAIKGSRQTASFNIDNKIQKSETTFQQFTVDQVDLAGLFRWVSEADPTGKAPMKPLHGRYVLEAMDMTMDGATVKIGKVVAEGFKARLARTAPIELMALIEASKAKPDDKVLGLKLTAFMLDAYSAFEFGNGSVDGMRFTGKDRKTGKAFTGGIGKIAFAGGAKPGASAVDFELKADDGAFTLKKLAFDGDFYGVMLAGIEKALSAAPAADADKATVDALRKQLADIVSATPLKDIALKLEGIDGDFPPAKDPKSPERVKFALTSFEMSMGGFVGAIPTKLDYAINSFRMPVPRGAPDPGLQTLRDLGIDVIDLSARIKGTWDEGKTRFVVDEIMTDLGKFAKVRLSGELGNIPRPLFENPMQNWPVAMMGGNIQNLAFSLENKGGIEKLITKTASDQKQTPEEFKMQLSAIAPALIGAYLGGHPDGPALSDAITKFIRTPGTLSITVKSTAPGGITVMDASAAASNPRVLLDKLKFEAVAK